MIDSINHILGTCGEAHPNIFFLIAITIGASLIKYNKKPIK
jgi:hypothetical protein